MRNCCRRCKSKPFIGKLWFLAEVTRTREDATSGSWFDQNLSIWHFVERKFTQRKRKNRLVGTVELKPVSAVRIANYVDMLLYNVFHVIDAKFLRRSQRGANYLQQDKVRTHVNKDDPLVSEVGHQLRLDVCVTCQPHNSSEFNVLKLGYIRSIHSL